MAVEMKDIIHTGLIRLRLCCSFHFKSHSKSYTKVKDWIYHYSEHRSGIHTCILKHLKINAYTTKLPKFELKIKAMSI